MICKRAHEPAIIVNLEKSEKMETVSFDALNEIHPLQHLDVIFVVCRAEREQICPVYKPLNVW